MTKPIKGGAPEFPYTEALGDEICNAIGSTHIGLNRLCDQNKDWPRRDTIFKWILNDSKFADKYAKAREMQQEVLVSHMMELSEDREHDFYTNEKGELKTNPCRVARDKLIADNIKWTAGRLSGRYKEKKDVNANLTTHESNIKDLA